MCKCCKYTEIGLLLRYNEELLQSVNQYVKIVLPLICVLLSVTMFGQFEVCTGNLGANIFKDGDFGKGNDLILSKNPNFSPSYIYTTFFPGDGFYTIAKTTDAWPLRPGWFSVNDNSPDNDGYMMIINASYDPGLFFERRISNLCPNTIYEFSSDIINLINTDGVGFIKPNIDFLIDNRVYLSTGDVPQNKKWNRYGFTFKTGVNQTSVIISMKNKAPGGKGNDLALDNVTFSPCGASKFTFESNPMIACQEELPITITPQLPDPTSNYIWQLSYDGGLNWTNMTNSLNSTPLKFDSIEPKNYFFRFISAPKISDIANDNCAVISNFLEIKLLPNKFTFFDTLCEGSSYQFGTNVLTQAGDYVSTFSSSYGCDSIVKLRLATKPKNTLIASVQVVDPSCFGYKDGAIEIDDISGGTTPYRINLTQNEIVGKLKIDNLSAGSYKFRVEDRFKCFKEFDNLIINPPKPELEIVEARQLSFGDEVTLSYNSNYKIASFDWKANGSIDCPKCTNPKYIAAKDDVIELKTITTAGCVAETKRPIKVKQTNNFITLSNVLLVGDVENGFLLAKSYQKALKLINHIVIRDRWGNTVKEDINIPIDFDKGMSLWDGKFNNLKVAEGVYTFLLQFTTIDDETHWSTGNVTVF